MSRTQRVLVVGVHAAGMSAAHQALRSAMVAGLGIGQHGGYFPDEHQRIDAGVWAAGDCCEVVGRIRAKHVFAWLGTHANKQGGVWGYNHVGGHRAFAQRRKFPQMPTVGELNPRHVTKEDEQQWQ
jgi:hypothetical protein